MNINQLEAFSIQNTHFPFFGSFMQQTPMAVLGLNHLLNRYYFHTIIELGTHDAGLSLFFAIYSYLSKMPCNAPDQNEPVLYKNQSHHKIGTNFFTFDIKVRDIRQSNLIHELGCYPIIADCLYSQDVINNIGEIINKSGKVLMLCDNGHKLKEFEIYSALLKKGDIIMTHDYGKDDASIKDLRERGVWNAFELTYGELHPIMVKNNIKQIHEDIFDECIWFCGEKV